MTLETRTVAGHPRGAQYPSAAIAGDLVFVSGQVSFDDAGAVVAEGDIRGQTRQTLGRLAAVLEACGSDLAGVAAATVYLTDAGHADAFNAEWGVAFGAHGPARATVIAQLLDPRLLVEVQAVAVQNRGYTS